MNAPMQGNGAEMMRLATSFGMQAGVQICCPVHDAFLIEAPVDEIDETVRAMQEAMSRAASAVLGGPTIGSDVKIVTHPDHYQDMRPEAVYMRRQIADAMAVIRPPCNSGTGVPPYRTTVPCEPGPGPFYYLFFFIDVSLMRGLFCDP